MSTATTTHRGSRPPILLAAIACASAITAVYLPSLRAWFLGDDLERIWRAVGPVRDVPAATNPAMHWRPVEDVSFWINHRLGELNPAVFHITNVALHVAISVAVGTASVQLVRHLTGQDPAERWSANERRVALVTTLAFGLAPSHAEAVVWIAGRGDLLMAAFALGALLAHVAAARPRLDAHPWRRRSLRAFALLLFAGALTSKEPAVALVGIVAVMELARVDPDPTRSRVLAAAMRTAPYLAVAVVWFAVRRVVLGSFVGGFGGAVEELRPLDPLRRMLSTLLRTLVPASPSPVWAALATVALAVGLAALTVLVRSPDRGRSRVDAVRLDPAVRSAAVFGLCAVLASIPVAGLGTSLFDSSGERLTYFPSVFAVLALGQLWGILRHQFAGAATAVAVIGVVGATALLIGEQRDWVRAGSMARESVAELGELPRNHRAVILNVPDTYDGIYVMRNAIPPALVLFHGWEEPSFVWQATGQRSVGDDAEVSVRRVPEIGTPTWDLAIEHSAADRGAAWDHLYPRSETTDSGAIAVERRDPATVRIGVEPTGAAGAAEGASVWWFDGTDLRPAG